MAKLIKKISVGKVFGDKKAIAEFIGKGEKAVMRVIGIAHKAIPGDGDMGPYVSFKGNFKAVNLLTGEEFRSGTCFLPDVAADIIEGAVMGSENGSVEFAFDIIATYDNSSAVGYCYNADPLIKADENDPVAALEKAAGIEAPKLAVPAKKAT